MGESCYYQVQVEQDPKVSIIVPAYNSERYIGDCLKSILAQTLDDIEVICVNDGSTDETLSIMQSYAEKDSRIRIIDKTNSGYGDSMNQGIDAAKGEYLGSVDSDDVVVPECYETLYRCAEQDNLDFVKSDRTWFVGTGQDVKSHRLTIARSDEIYGHVINPSANPASCGIKPGQPGLYRISFLNAYGIRHNDSPGASFQDTGFWAQSIFNATRAEVISKQLYKVRRDNPGSSELDKTKVFEICNEYAFIREKAESVSSERRRACILSCASMMYDSYFWNINRLSPDQAEKFLKRFCCEFRHISNAGELDCSYFANEQWEQVQILIEHPVLFYANYCDKEKRALKSTNSELKAENKRLCLDKKELNSANEQLKNRLSKIEKSRSYLLGRAITKPARMVRSSLKSARKGLGK